MDELIIRSLQGRSTDAEEVILQAWRAESPENERKYQEIARLWELTSAASPMWEGQVPSVSELLGPESDDSAASSPAGIRGDSRGRVARTVDQLPSRPSRLGRQQTRLFAAAAAIALIGFGIGVEMNSGRSSFLSDSEIVTGAGEMTTLTLGDGSTVRLGPQSRLRLVEKGDQRVAQLDGRAFFGVESDPSRPFTVKTNYGDAEVSGTRFEVRSEEEEFRVLVVEGSVAVSAGGSEVRLSESQMSRSRKGGSPTTERVSDVFQHLDWLGNTLVFQATPVGRAFEEIERRYGVEIVIDDPSISRLTVTASFTGQSVDDVVQIICEIIGARCAADGETVRVSILGGSARMPAEA